MVLSIGENLSASFGFAKDGLVGNWLRWIILAVLLGISLIIEFGMQFVIESIDLFSVLFIVFLIALFIATCIASFIASGYLVKIYKGGDEAPELEGYVEMFFDGIKLAIIQFIYVLIPLILIFAGIIFAGPAFGDLALLVGSAGEATVEVTDAAAEVALGAASGGLLLILIGTVLAIIFGLVAVIAGIRFAKTEEFGEGFNFGAIFATLKEIGWGHYILSYILFIILAVIISSILGAIPFIGWLLLVIILPLLFLWQGKFFENLYSCT